MGNPLVRYKFQIGPFISGLDAAIAGNVLVAKGYSLDSTMFQTAHNTGDRWYLTCSGGWTTPRNAYTVGNTFASNNGYSVGAQPITVAADKTYGETNGHLKSQLYCWTEMYWPPVNTIGICSIDATLFVDNAPLIGQYINFSVFSKNQNKVINTF